jgi:PAS domain S-box-containing protein
VDTAKLGTWELDIATGVMECSGRCKQNFGKTPADRFGYSDLLASIHEDDVAPMQEAVRTAIEDGVDYRAEYRVVWPDGSLHWVVASGRTTYATDGSPIRMVGVTMDVTERHLSMQALMQTEKLAAVGRLASSIAHEINNPLEAVTNLLFLARHSDVGMKAQEYLELADRELRRVAAISSQTLQFHRQSTGARMVNCEDLFDSVLSIYQGRLVNARIQVRRRKGLGCQVRCFDGEVRQVLNNLVSNAIDAMRGTEGQLLLRSRRGHDWRTGRRGVVLSVADTGAGIEPHALAHMFDPLFLPFEVEAGKAAAGARAEAEEKQITA